jgi:hypothetical protein
MIRNSGTALVAEEIVILAAPLLVVVEKQQNRRWIIVEILVRDLAPPIRLMLASCAAANASSQMGKLIMVT